METEPTQIKLLALSTSYLATSKPMIVCYARMKNHDLNQTALLTETGKMLLSSGKCNTSFHDQVKHFIIIYFSCTTCSFSHVISKLFRDALHFHIISIAFKLERTYYWLMDLLISHRIVVVYKVLLECKCSKEALGVAEFV